jgi:tRNA(fMet)-specific endonuclease VapC
MTNGGYLLDTSTLSFILNGNIDVARKLRAVTTTQIAYCSVITEGELLYGAFRAGRQRREDLLAEITLLLSDLTAILPVTRDVASVYGKIKRDLASRGEIIGLNDAWIGATALSGGLTLATSDRGFGRIRDLVLEDWLEP